MGTTDHAEAQPDELWLGNTERDSQHFQSLRAAGLASLRQGKVAYCIEGKPLPNTYAPLFIKKAEQPRHEDIMMTKAFGPHWRTRYRG